MPVTHEVGVRADFYDALLCGEKMFELRNNHRNYQVGDVLRLKEEHWRTKKFTGWEIEMKITFILRYEDFPEGMVPGWVILSLGDVD